MIGHSHPLQQTRGFGRNGKLEDLVQKWKTGGFGRLSRL